MSVKALVLRTAGTNCDGETLHALSNCGAEADLLHLSEVLRDPNQLSKYKILVVPGGFSYGDDIAAGKVLANELKFKLGDHLRKFVAEKKLMIGICNGFQVLVKAGFLPGADLTSFAQTATLAHNDSGRFQCEWVGMKKVKSKATWLSGLPSAFELPIAHGEGRFVARDAKTLNDIEKNGQVILRYAPRNPNGSQKSIAGVCNALGNVVGMMPHPERFFTPFQHPAWGRSGTDKETPGYIFWNSAVKHARTI